jgi:hypothetical protein
MPFQETREVGIGRISVSGQPGKENFPGCKTPSQPKKAGQMGHSCHPSDYYKKHCSIDKSVQNMRPYL